MTTAAMGAPRGADVSSMTWENLTADADALREKLGFEKWAVLGHSFGGYVALEYALRYPNRLSHLVLVDTGGDSRWAQENAPEVLAQRGYSPEIVNLARRFLNGQIEPGEMFPSLMKLGTAYTYHLSPGQIPAYDPHWFTDEAETRSPDLRGNPFAQGLVCHGPAQRDQGTHPDPGRP